MAYEYENHIINQHSSDFKSKTGKLIDTNESLELREVYAKAKAFDEIRKIEKSCYYVNYDKDNDIDREGFETHNFTRNVLQTIRNWEDK